MDTVCSEVGHYFRLAFDDPAIREASKAAPGLEQWRVRTDLAMLAVQVEFMGRPTGRRFTSVHVGDGTEGD